MPDDLGPLWADPDRLEQVVANLVENAVRHGDGTVRAGGAALGAQRPARGRPPRQRRRRRASRPSTASSSSRGSGRAGPKHGTGLGLYLVRGLVEAHGGVVRAEDAPGGGALMRATFPDRD